MEDTSPPPPMPPGWDEEALLLREALAFIGDLDEGELSPSFLGVDGDAALSPPSPLAPTATVPANSTNTSDAFFSSLLAEPVIPAATVEATPPTQHPGPEAEHAPACVWPISAPPSSSNKPSKPVGNRARNKRREELLYLRETVGELQQQLTGLKRQAGDEQLKQTAEQDRPSALVVTAWEQVATSQYAQRQESERINTQLKRLLEEQIQVGKSLERLLLRKRPKFEAANASIGYAKRRRHGSVSAAWDDQQIFHELLASIDNQYADTPRVLAKVAPLVSGKHNHRSVELVRDEELGMVLRSTESRILPFEYELVLEEFLTSMPPVINDKITGFHELDVSEDLLKAQFQATANFGRASGELMAFIVERRFREATRTVYVSSALFDPKHVSGMNMDGVYMRHKGWVVFEPLAASGTTKAATRMTSYFLSVPEVFDGLEDSTHKVGTLTNFVMTALSIELESRQQQFENRLFDRATAAAK